MVKTQATVEGNDKDDCNGKAVEIVVRTHWNRENLVEIIIGDGKKCWADANELIKAIQRCSS